MRDGQSQYSKVVSPRAFISMKLSKKLRATLDSINVNIMQVNIKLKINFKGTLISFHTLELVEVVLPNPVLKKSSDGMEVVSSWSPFTIAYQLPSIISLKVSNFYYTTNQWLDLNKTTLFSYAQFNGSFSRDVIKFKNLHLKSQQSFSPHEA